jgi:translation initiation factor IF-3
LKLSVERNLDLVEISPSAKPPVCKVMDFGKFKYEQSKHLKEAKKKQRIVTIKEVRMTPKIETHDFEVKFRNAEKFLKDGDKVKASVRFRGREIIHSDIAKNLLLELGAKLAEVAVIEKEPKVEGRSMVMFLSPKAEQ